jgi:hypothetical protein
MVIFVQNSCNSHVLMLGVYKTARGCAPLTSHGRLTLHYAAQQVDQRFKECALFWCINFDDGDEF